MDRRTFTDTTDEAQEFLLHLRIAVEPAAILADLRSHEICCPSAEATNDAHMHEGSKVLATMPETPYPFTRRRRTIH